MKLKTLTLALCTASLLVACAKSPLGRNQLKLYSSDQLSAMGSQAFDSMKSEQKVSSAPVQNQYVTCVARHIADQVSDDVYAGQWEIVVFDDDQVNAFALPGGKIGVYTGLLKVAKNQHQLAAVLGHEVGHVIAGHSNERMSNSTLIGIGMEATSQILQAGQVGNSQMIMAGLGLASQVGIQLPFSRVHESEADLIGLQLMAKAGFNPQESVELWKNMEQASGGQRQPELLSTHPAPQSRIENLSANMSPALKDYKTAKNKPDCRE
ncbi:M48 family metallopeptidase [Bowmanella dokdonensis]|uniref:M48 family metallopeptidase n=1 Tax=Bowmanella dokdonensis TaxID=751969 RepID=A0A939DLS5_9ALTE|nr:M48 family metallopeptidase [Bowmanella dokdonensis]MBN7824181.1 M48 family metallopeptidase [Bowmanella dokdonensis]